MDGKTRVPLVTLRTIVDGHEEAISEYICDWPDCPHVGVHVFAVAPALRLRAVMCAEHAARVANRSSTDRDR
jgi:hypothetical protein